jgi:predicted transposase/invertase (TIGR01784 family)
MCEHSLFYWSEIFYKQLEKGDTYDYLKKTICINILEFQLFADQKFWHTYHMREDKMYELLTDLEEIHFLELSKIKDFRKNVPVTWWLEYLKNPHSQVVEEIGKFEPIIVYRDVDRNYYFFETELGQNSLFAQLIERT